MSQVPFEFDELRGDDLALELDAMMSIGRVLASLRGPESRARALRWALDRFMPPTDIEAEAVEATVVMASRPSDAPSLVDATGAATKVEGGHSTSSPYAVFEREKERARRKRPTMSDEA
jgi:hypothetical protein